MDAKNKNKKRWLARASILVAVITAICLIWPVILHPLHAQTSSSFAIGVTVVAPQPETPPPSSGGGGGGYIPPSSPPPTPAPQPRPTAPTEPTIPELKKTVEELREKVNELVEKPILTTDKEKQLDQYEKKLTKAEDDLTKKQEKRIENLLEKIEKLEEKEKLSPKEELILRKYAKELLAAKEEWRAHKMLQIEELVKLLAQLAKKKKPGFDDLLKRFKYKQKILKIEDDLLKALRRDIREYKGDIEELGKDGKLTALEKQAIKKISLQLKTLEKEKNIISAHRTGINKLGLKIGQIKQIKRKTAAATAPTKVRGFEEPEKIISAAAFEALEAEIDALAEKPELSPEEEQKLEELERTYEESAVEPQEYGKILNEFIKDAGIELKGVPEYQPDPHEIFSIIILTLSICVLILVSADALLTFRGQNPAQT